MINPQGNTNPPTDNVAGLGATLTALANTPDHRDCLEVFAELANEPKFVAVKESSENVRRVTDLKNTCGDRYLLFCGVDDLVLESAVLGAVGWVSGLVNAFPAENRLLWDLLKQGKIAEAACSTSRTGEPMFLIEKK